MVMMRYITLLFVAAVLISGCAQEAIYADQEYGKATQDAFDQQIVHKDYKHANKTEEHLDGIHAEPIMGVYQGSFGEGFTGESINTLQ